MSEPHEGPSGPAPRLGPDRPSWLDPTPSGPPPWLRPEPQPPVEPAPARRLPEPRLSRPSMVVELGLVLLLAFAPALLSLALTAAAGASDRSTASITLGEAAIGMALTVFFSWSPPLVLFYLLRRNGEGPATIGLARPTRRDLGAAVLLLVASYLVVWALTPIFSRLGSTDVEFLSHDLPVWFLAVQALLIAATAGVTEEVLVRGYAQTRLEQLGLPGPVVVLAPTAMWSLLHVYQGWSAVAIIFGLGLLWATYFQRTRRLLPLILAHIMYDLLGLIWILSGR